MPRNWAVSRDNQGSCLRQQGKLKMSTREVEFIVEDIAEITGLEIEDYDL